MPKVVIDGIEYVPKVEITPPSDEKLLDALKELVSIQYFKEKHKAIPQAWNVLNHLNPELAELCAQDPAAAWSRLHGEDG